jgi:hypothetical protein
VSGPQRRHHTCDFCLFLGRYGPDDLYFCPGASRAGKQVDAPAVAVRFGSEAADCRHLAVKTVLRKPGSHWARCALELATARGLVEAPA